jgi:hypothetical protein
MRQFTLQPIPSSEEFLGEIDVVANHYENTTVRVFTLWKPMA